jgi:ubiquinone/menaquinone biosynthesis C-methylase UbiE
MAEHVLSPGEMVSPIAEVVMKLELKYQQQATLDKQFGVPSSYDRIESIDNWRHTRMRDMAAPLFDFYPNSRWMTVGDGRYGSDAAYLLQHQVTAVASSLTDDLLKQASDRGYIKEFRAENAEKLSAPDDSFDFVLCKESYHHFPRPPVALYEMLRVARCGVVLIEPLDSPRLLNWLRNVIKRVLRGTTQHEYEPSGNYLYRVSIRELRKILLAMDGSAIAHKGFNDFFVASLSNYRARGFNFGNVITRLGVKSQNVLAKCQLMGYGLASVVVFKCAPVPGVLEGLRAAGFTVEQLPKNPYGLHH